MQAVYLWELAEAGDEDAGEAEEELGAGHGHPLQVLQLEYTATTAAA